MERLPVEIVLDILTRLPITSYLQFKCVCKAWFKLAQDPHLLNLYQASAIEKNPCLILHCDSALQDELYAIETTRETFETLTRKLGPPFESVMPNFEISGSCNGFLCLYDLETPGSTVYIYNPFTHESIQLPPPNINFSNDQGVAMGFGFHPTTKEYKVIRTVYCYPPKEFRFGWLGYGRSDTSIYTIGTDSWRSLGEAAHWLDRRSPTALVNGALHWLTQAHKYKQFQDIVSFDLATEKFSKVPGPSCESFKRHWYSIVEIGGCLCSVSHTGYYGEVEVWVMKDYNVKESWTKEFIIRDYGPFGVNTGSKLSSRMREKWFSRGSTRVLCLMKTGEILLEYGNQALVSYNPETEEFKDLNFRVLPSCFESVTVMGTIVSLQASIEMLK